MKFAEKAEYVLIRLQRNSNMARQKGIIRKAIEDAYKAGVEAEREASAKMVDELRSRGIVDGIGDAIRARS